MVRSVAADPQLANTFRKELDGELPWLVAVFVEFSEATTRMEDVEISVTSKTSGRTKVVYKRCPGVDCLPDGSASWRLCSTKASDQEAREIIGRVGVTPTAIQQIISLERKRNIKVGGAIDVLVVEPFGVRWDISSRDGCQAIK